VPMDIPKHLTRSVLCRYSYPAAIPNIV
jgi:hypothetical protein